jgi:glucose-6-phosphate 1-epimerase
VLATFAKGEGGTMNVSQLNNEHGITDHIKFIEGTGGFPYIRVDNAKASAIISVYGGQVLSYQPANEPHNLMFLSEKAYYQPGKSIKGGIPICWPWFGPDPEGRGRPLHGFARNRFWEVVRTEATPEEEDKVTLKLSASEETRVLWPHSFDLVLEITVGDTLNLELITHNTTSETFSITQAFHTYFRVGDIRQVIISGLAGAAYVDKTDSGAIKFQAGPVTIDKEVDRIFRNVPAELVIDDKAFDRRIRINSKGSNSAVVWNPWVKISSEMADLDDDDYEHFVCVETTNADLDVVQVPPGDEARLAANYRVERDIS